MTTEAGLVLEDWQWREAEDDHRLGTGTLELAERYGVKHATMRKHMERAGIRPWWSTGGKA